MKMERPINILEYEDSLKEISDDVLKAEIKSMKKHLSDIEAAYVTNQNMISKHIDDPGLEHLIEFSINASPSEDDLALIKTKIHMAEQEADSRGIIVGEEEIKEV